MKKKKSSDSINFREHAKKSGVPEMIKDLRQVSDIANRLKTHQETQEKLEEQLATVKGTIWRIQTEELPALMQQYGLSEFKLTDGSKITVKPFVKASLPAEGTILKCKDLDKRAEMRDRLTKAFSYLRKQGAGSLIKSFLKADFGKESEALAKKAMTELRKLGVHAEMAKNVHPQTLTAWVRERLEAGKKIDMELFAVQSGEMASIDRGKGSVMPQHIGEDETW